MKNKKQISRLILMLLLFAGSQVCDVSVLLARQSNPAPTRSKSPSNTNPNQNSRNGSSSVGSQTKPSPNATSNSRQERSAEDDEQRAPQKEVSGGQKQNAETAVNEQNNDEEYDWWALAQWILIGIGSLLALAVVIIGAVLLIKNKRKRSEAISGNFDHLRKQQRAFDGEIRRLEGEIKQVAEVSKNLSQQIAQQKSEISALKQMSQKASYIAPAPPTISSYEQPAAVPQFPVSVDDYLTKVKNGAIPVKYDYKEKMLVEDGENEGGLLIVQDDSAAGSSLYLVPSFGFFQTKSDYTSYFENYYSCARPTGGSVWIRQPARVTRVNGGWQLAQQGELEIR